MQQEEYVDTRKQLNKQTCVQERRHSDRIDV